MQNSQEILEKAYEAATKGNLHEANTLITIANSRMAYEQARGYIPVETINPHEHVGIVNPMTRQDGCSPQDACGPGPSMMVGHPPHKTAAQKEADAEFEKSMSIVKNRLRLDPEMYQVYKDNMAVSIAEEINYSEQESVNGVANKAAERFLNLLLE